MGSVGMKSEDLGFSNCMGPELREFVEGQLLDDLVPYMQSVDRFDVENIRFDWSESCIEGHRTHWLDGEIQNFSGIAIFDDSQNLIAEGWMEFIETEIGLVVFWWYLRGGEAYNFQNKASNRVPKHIWKKLSPKIRTNWSPYAPNKRRLP